MSEGSFDWSCDGKDADSIIVRGFGSVAVYTNKHDAVVIRQEDPYDPSEDHYIYLNRAQVPALALAMLSEAGIALSRPLKPQLAELTAQPFAMKQAANFFKALSDELTDGDDMQPGPIRRDIARMMAERPDINWSLVLADTAHMFDEHGSLIPIEGEPEYDEQGDDVAEPSLPLVAVE